MLFVLRRSVTFPFALQWKDSVKELVPDSWTLLSGLGLAQITQKETPPLGGTQCLESLLKNYRNKSFRFCSLPLFFFFIPLNGFSDSLYNFYVHLIKKTHTTQCVYRPKCDFTLFLDPAGFIFLQSKLVWGFCSWFSTFFIFLFPEPIIWNVIVFIFFLFS